MSNNPARRRPNRFLNWILFEAILPIVIVYLIYLATKWMLFHSWSFERVFLSGDLLILGGMLLIGQTLDLDEFALRSAIKSTLLKSIAIFFIVIYIAMYGGIKIFYLGIDFTLFHHRSSDFQASCFWISWVTILMYVISVAYCLLVKTEDY